MKTPPLARIFAGSVARWSGVLVLNYHRIGDGRRSIFDRGLWSATADDFDRQVRYLKKEFDVIAPRDIRYVLKVKRGRHVIITFDDGYADNATAAFPILRSHGVPGVFFVATGYIDQPHMPWWDEIAWMVRTSKLGSVFVPDFRGAAVAFDEPERERAVRKLLHIYKRLPESRTEAYLDALGRATRTGRPPKDMTDVRELWMTWDMLREMHAGGMIIGGHTVHHPILSRMPRDLQRAEIEGCAARLRQELGAPMLTFAYPVGSRDAFNADTRDCLREAGVRTAFSYYGGVSRLGAWDNYDIPRIPVEQDTTFDEFRASIVFPWNTT